VNLIICAVKTPSASPPSTPVLECLGLVLTFNPGTLSVTVIVQGKLTILSLVDNFSKKCHSLSVGQSMKGANVINQLEHLKVLKGFIPERIQCDNGSEFISREVDRWAYENGVILDFSSPGKPTDNPYVDLRRKRRSQSFNGKFRDECLSVNWFLFLDDARMKINSWRDVYNFFRPHSSLDDLTTEEFINLHS
jgi:putative transposase